MSSNTSNIIVIERDFQSFKQDLQNSNYWDEETLKKRVEEGWRLITQKHFDKEILYMKDRSTRLKGKT